MWGCRGQGLKRVPICRNIVALREKAGDFLTLCFTPEPAAEVTLYVVRRDPGVP